jgi:DNA-directed RNA polymerase specialized sigma24 family protein
MLPDSLEDIFKEYCSWIKSAEPFPTPELETAIRAEMSWLAACMSDPSSGRVDLTDVHNEFETRVRRRLGEHLLPDGEPRSISFWTLVSDCARQNPIHTKTRLMWRWKALGDPISEEEFFRRIQLDFERVMRAVLKSKGLFSEMDDRELWGEFWQRVSKHTPPEMWSSSRKFLDWSWRVLERLSIDHVRVRKRESERLASLVSVAEPVADDNAVLIAEFRDFLDRLESSFPKKGYKEIATLAMMGLEVEQIAFRTHLSIATVYRRRSTIKELWAGKWT